MGELHCWWKSGDEAAHSAHLNEPSFAKARDASKEWVVDRKVTAGITD
jgi:quinol monooxygenase YgiN